MDSTITTSGEGPAEDLLTEAPPPPQDSFAYETPPLYSGQPEGGVPSAEPPAPGKRIKNKKWLFIAGGAFALVIVAVCLTLLLGGRSITDTRAVWAYIDSDSTAYIVAEKGRVIKLSGDEISSAVMTPDRKHIVALCKDRGLYITDGQGKKKTVLDGEASGIATIRDAGFIYYSEQESDVKTILQDFVKDYSAEYSSITYSDAEKAFLEAYTETVDNAKAFYEYYLYVSYDEAHKAPVNYYRYLFQDGSTVELGSDVASYRVSDTSLHFLYSTEKGIYVLRQGDKEPEKLQGIKGTSVMPLAISNENGVAVWGDSEDMSVTLYTASGDEASLFGKMEVSYEDALQPWCSNIYFLNGERELLFASYYSDVLLYGTVDGEEADSLRLGAEPIDTALYTESGALPVSSEKGIDGVYIELKNDENSDIYYVSMDGEREKVVSGVDDLIGVTDGILYYQTEDGDLYKVRAKGAELGEDEKLASDVYLGYIDPGGFVYYFRDYDDETSSSVLYRIAGNKEPVKVDSDVYLRLYPNESGAVGYYTDYEGTDSYDEDYSRCGLLYVFDGKDSHKIASDVMDIGYTGMYYSLDQFAFLKYDYTDTEDGATTTYCKLCYFDGKKTSTIAEDILYLG